MSPAGVCQANKVEPGQCDARTEGLNQVPSSEASSSRRETLFMSVSYVSLASLLPDWLTEEIVPEKGNCATCIGVVDGTLGSCASEVNSCLSSYDDRPGHFIAPWTFDDRPQSKAMSRLVGAVEEAGATSIQQDGNSYLYAVFEGQYGTDDVEFLFAENDVTVELRSSSRYIKLPDGGRNERRLDFIRNSLGWENVPILRNRQRALVVIESPFDSFGPVPPSTGDYTANEVVDMYPE
eukprot:gene16271-22451_t